MSTYELLAEARIREWLSRPPAERAAYAPDPDPALPLEVQLMADIAVLDRLRAETTDPAERAAMKQKADELTMRVLVLFEAEGRPLAARQFAERRAAR